MSIRLGWLLFDDRHFFVAFGRCQRALSATGIAANYNEVVSHDFAFQESAFKCSNRCMC